MLIKKCCSAYFVVLFFISVLFWCFCNIFSHIYFCHLLQQEITPDSFTTHPIIFGDFLKMGANKEDRLYEELADHKKLAQVLQDVSISTSTVTMF